ncbi:MAG: HAD-IIA family hydrolase [Ruminococcaceae bacterium]|nr:HAD-IIA family hydrolase [Oscillospiraceae bacterium]
MTLYNNTPENLKKLSETKLFVLDMDGTIYLGKNPIDGAIDFCERIIKSGRKLMYFTNNASRNPNDYVKKLNSLGFPCERDMIVTSGDVTIAYLKKYYPGKPVYLVGTPALEESFTQAGITLSDKSDIVVVSFDLTLTYEKLEKACTLIRNGAKFFSTHPDINCPTEDGYIPDSGAICGAVTLSTGVEPRYFGKPYAETVEMIETLSGIDRKHAVMVGDRLYTDIALGKKNGMLSMLVMSGETTDEMVQKASDAEKPDLIFESVANVEL